MKHITINSRKVGEGYPIYIIAEGCDNHMGDMNAAKEMCKRAKLAGANCIKFQHHLPDEEMLRDVPMTSNFDIPLYDFLKRYALTLDQHIELKRYCKEIGIQYLCTPFSLKAAYELNEIGVDAFKIGSGEMTDIPTLVKIAELQKPMIISTGMCTIEEIQNTYETLVSTGVEFAFTNCLSEYPPRYEDVNLNVIGILKEKFPHAVIGHSDHTPDLYTCFAAIALGASIIEKHVITNKQMAGPDQSVSIDFYDLHCLSEGIRKIEVALGNEKKVNEKEQEIRNWAFRSIVALKDIPIGTKITQDMIWSKRPGTGIPSLKMEEIIGKVAIENIKVNTLLKWTDIE